MKIIILAILVLLCSISLIIAYRLTKTAYRLSKMSKLPTCSKGIIEEEHNITRMKSIQLWIASSE